MAENILNRISGAIFKAAPTQTIGTSRTEGNVTSGEGAGTFDEPNRELNLVGTRRFQEYDRLVRDVSIIGASARLFLNLISNAVWTCNPPTNLNDNELPAAQEYADQAYATIFGMTTSWSSVVRKSAAFKLYGFCIQEWTAKKNDDGTIGIKDIEHRPQKTITKWMRDEGGTVEAVIQRVPGRPDVELPRSKIIYSVDDTLTDSPEGVGLFRHLVVSATKLETYLALEEIGLTTDLRGIPIARVPLAEMRQEAIDSGPEGSPARAEADARRMTLLTPLRQWLDKHMRNTKSGMLLPSDTYISTGVDKSTSPTAVPKWSLELLNGESQSFEAMANAINRLNQELARTLGTEHLMLGADGSGSLALARSKVGTFYLTVTSTLLDLLEIYDRDLITPWADLNGIPEELRPQMGVNEISDRDIDQLLEGIAKLAQAGAPMMPDDPAVGEIYDLWGLTRPPERIDDMGLSLNPGRNDPPAKDDPNGDKELDKTPEDGIAKTKVLRSRRNMAKARRR